jgi:hypothetical protein
VVNSPGFIPTTFTNVYDPQGASVSQGGVVYTGSLSVAACPLGSSYATNMRQLTVTIGWVTQGRIPHTRILHTFIARDGIQNYVY